MTPTTEPLVRVGIAAFVFNPDGQILLGKRQGSHGAGTFPLQLLIPEPTNDHHFNSSILTPP